MADALNRRIHHGRIDPDAPTMSVACGQMVAVGDVIISRRNDPTIAFHRSTPNPESLPSVRNGNRWRVAALNPNTNRLAAERLDDGARALFGPDYFREHVSLGYAVTVHSAQGATADASIAVLSETTSRNLLYVAMTRGRHANHAHIYERSIESSEFGHQDRLATHTARRGDHNEAVTLVRVILANDEPTVTAHDYAPHTAEEVLPDRVGDLLFMRANANQRRQADYQASKTQRREQDRHQEEVNKRHIDRSQYRSTDYGLEL
ncbi:ATP-binding domain-containing protein [Mycolicibacterium novocastrense]|nr:ATP-binding domain-containing protein [Mycolicibacterium novocastrense]